MATTNKNQFVLDIAFHPGEMLQEKIEELEMSIKELALRTDKPEKSIIEVLQGQASITPDLAVRLENVLTIPAQYWLRLQRVYDEYLVRKHRTKELEGSEDWAKMFPVKDMVAKGMIEPSADSLTSIQTLLSFFKINSPNAWSNFYLESKLPTSFRISLSHTAQPHAISAWLRAGEIQAEKQIVQPFDKKELRRRLPELKAILIKAEPSFFADMQAVCAQSGVNLVFTPSLKGSPANGVTRWINDKPLIQLSDRYQRYDGLWFTFFHEIGHVLLHGKKEVFLEFEKGKYQGQDDIKEAEANDFAARTLLSLAHENELLSQKQIKVSDIDRFALKFGTHPSIIVGRLHHKNYWHYAEGQAKILSLKGFQPFAGGVDLEAS
jgi:HTH-type transcriptional regulator / antitoxin HigA